MILEVLTSMVAVWLAYFLAKTYAERRGRPPGPFPLPFVGNLHQLGSNPPFTIDNLWQKYGDVYQITFPVGTFVIVNSGKAAREALVTRKDDFAGRPTDLMYPIDVILEGKNIGNGDYGPHLMFRRKILKSALHVFGEGAQHVEKRVNSAVMDLLKHAEEMNGKAFYIQDYVAGAIASQLWEWLSSKKTSFEDKTLKEIIVFNENITSLARQGNYYQMLPILTYLPTTFMKSIRDTVELRDNIFARELEDHRRTYSDGVIRDVTDALICSYETEKSKSSGKDIGPIEDLKFLMIDVMLAGADTSRTVVAWCILFLVLRTELQVKLQEEIDRQVGVDRLPRWEDVKRLHNVQSFVCEVLRYTSLFPWMPHRAIRDTTLNGYHVPKNTPIFINFYRIHKDPEEWDDPESFKADRFLDSEGNFAGWTTMKAFLPFGVGRRSCVGQDLGKMQVFGMVSNLIHQFTLELPKGEPKPSLLDTVSGFIHQPKSHKVIARKRDRGQFTSH